MREFETGATRDSEDGKIVPSGFISAAARLRFSKYMHDHRKQADGRLRDPDNWKRGIPQRVYFESLVRHVLDAELFVEGNGGTVYPQEDHSFDDVLCAILFNVLGLLHERTIGREVGVGDRKLFGRDIERVEPETVLDPAPALRGFSPTAGEYVWPRADGEYRSKHSYGPWRKVS